MSESWSPVNCAAWEGLEVMALFEELLHLER